MTKPDETSRIVEPGALERLREEVGASAFARFIRDFVQVSERRLGELRQALEARDAEALADAAHALRGCAAYLGVQPAVERCSQLEAYAQSQDLAAAADTLVELERLLMQARELLTAHLPA
ncbi:MAG: Hpt domain-containing protein [Planctomycetota bacterium]|jgi:HPt (histidine-containing phosphotransfer) domain-containing protein